MIQSTQLHSQPTNEEVPKLPDAIVNCDCQNDRLGVSKELLVPWIWNPSATLTVDGLSSLEGERC